MWGKAPLALSTHTCDTLTLYAVEKSKNFEKISKKLQWRLFCAPTQNKMAAQSTAVAHVWNTTECSRPCGHVGDVVSAANGISCSLPRENTRQDDWRRRWPCGQVRRTPRAQLVSALNDNQSVNAGDHKVLRLRLRLVGRVSRSPLVLPSGVSKTPCRLIPFVEVE